MPNIIEETFSRTSGSGWGTADLGGSWTIDGGAASEYTIDGSVGKITPASDNDKRASLTVSDDDWEVLTKFRFVSTGARSAECHFGIPLRFSSFTNTYEFMVFMTNTGVLGTRIWRTISGSTITLLSDQDYAVGDNAGVWTWMQIQCIGNILRMRGWLDGDSPPAWRQVTDNTFTSGTFAIRYALFNTANLPNLEIDSIIANDAELVSPQIGNPDADLAAGGWSPAPTSPTTLHDKLSDESDSSYIHATAS